jgi:hypothetical protein
MRTGKIGIAGGRLAIRRRDLGLQPPNPHRMPIKNPRRCGNSRSRTWRAAARWTATRHSDHGKRGRSGGTRPPPLALRGPRTSRQTGTRSGTVGTSTSSDSSGLAVAQTLLAAIMRYRAVVLRLRWPRFVEIAQSGRRNTRVKPAPLTQERSRVKRTVSSSILCTALCRRSPFLRRVRDLETVLAVFLPIVPACLLHLHY